MESLKENTLNLRYFAILREQRGVSSERVKTDLKTALDLYGSLARQYDFTLPVDRVRVAVNDSFENMDIILKDGDTVVFIPPVAGG